MEPMAVELYAQNMGVVDRLDRQIWVHLGAAQKSQVVENTGYLLDVVYCQIAVA